MTPRASIRLRRASRPPGAAPLPTAAVVVAVALLGASGCQRMMDQPKYLPYGASTFFPDGRAMRPVPEGTVPRERQLGDTAFTTGRGPDGAFLDAVRVPITRATLERGRQGFESICANCHGLLGDGKSVPASKMGLRPPPSLLDPPLPPGRIFAAITGGYGFMPTFAAELPPDERWAVVAYVQALQRSQRARLEDAPDAVRRRLQQP